MDKDSSNNPGLNQELTAIDFKPLDGPGERRKWAISPGYLVLTIISLLAVLVLLYLFAARAVIFRSDPENAQIEVSGLSFNIGSNYLLLPGQHLLSALAEGYYPLEQPIEVSGERTQEIEIRLEALPGKLNLISEIEDVEVSIDDEPAGTAPGVIPEISRGSHIIGFTRHRYFPQKQEIDIEGLGRTQSLTVVMEPAWGQMQFSSVPDGAELYIDGQLMGTTPLTTEVLETGSMASIAAKGYKTWEKEVSVKAGSTGNHPTVELVVADGTLAISSSPRGASITIDRVFSGTTPTSVPLSPLSDHQVELYLEGYAKAVRRVSIEPEQESSLSVTLTPIIGRIQVTISPADAELLVDGRVRGIGSQMLSLTAKEHDISVRKPGYVQQDLKVTPRPDHQQSLEISLLTIQQDYWASRPPQINSPLGTPMKLFRPDSTFKMGAPRRQPGRRANEAERMVQLERPFYMATHEVTNEQFRRWKEEHSSRAIQGQSLDMDKQPAVYMTWQEAAIFCNWLSRHEGLPLFYIEEQGRVSGFNIDSHGYRLPTEAEWAWVARINSAGESQIFPWENQLYPPSEIHGNYADINAVRILSFTLSNYDDGFAVSAPVGSFDPNGKGMYDMSGNVSEWTNDFYEIRASNGPPELDPTGPAVGVRHVVRGASWAKASRSELRLSYREAGADGGMDIGFRLARYVDKAGANQ